MKGIWWYGIQTDFEPEIDLAESIAIYRFSLEKEAIDYNRRWSYLPKIRSRADDSPYLGGIEELRNAERLVNVTIVDYISTLESVHKRSISTVINLRAAVKEHYPLWSWSLMEGLYFTALKTQHIFTSCTRDKTVAELLFVNVARTQACRLLDQIVKAIEIKDKAIDSITIPVRTLEQSGTDSTSNTPNPASLQPPSPTPGLQPPGLPSLLQLTGHFTRSTISSVEPGSGMPTARRDISPFRPNSPSVRMQFAAHQREAQMAQALRNQINQQMSPQDSSTPKTISPKDAVLDYHHSDEDGEIPLFPDAGSFNQQRRPSR